MKPSTVVRCLGKVEWEVIKLPYSATVCVFCQIMCWIDLIITNTDCHLIINTIYNCQIAEKWNGWWSDWWLKGWGSGAHLLPTEAIVTRKNKQTLPKAQWTQWTHRVLDSFNTFNFTEAIVVRKNQQTLPKAQWTFFCQYLLRSSSAFQTARTGGGGKRCWSTSFFASLKNLQKRRLHFFIRIWNKETGGEENRDTSVSFSFNIYIGHGLKLLLAKDFDKTQDSQEFCFVITERL